MQTLLVRARGARRPVGYRLFDLDRGGAVPLARSRARSARDARARAARGRSRRAATSSPRRTRACSAAATTPTSASCRRARRHGDRVAARRDDAVRWSHVAPAGRRGARWRCCSRCCSLRSFRRAARGAEGALGDRLPALRGRRRVRGGRAADRLDARRSSAPTTSRAACSPSRYLGAGSAWLLLPRRARDVLLGALGVATVAAAIAVAARARGRARARRSTASGRPPANGALGGHAFLWAAALNTFGSVFLIGGSLLFDRAAATRAHEPVDRRPARSSSRSRPACRARGDYSFVYAGELRRDRADVRGLPARRRAAGAEAPPGADAGRPCSRSAELAALAIALSSAAAGRWCGRRDGHARGGERVAVTERPASFSTSVRCSGRTKVMPVPLRPARPVRPTRCT